MGAICRKEKNDGIEEKTDQEAEQGHGDTAHEATLVPRETYTVTLGSPIIQ
jgi:hypothetical protein